MSQPAVTRTFETYQRLRDAVVRGELRPNERLVEAELAERLAVSRTPVRECLQRLASEGLIANRRRGWVVLEHGPVEIAEIYEVRAALEGFAARLAAERASDRQLDDIVQVTEVEPCDYTAPPRSKFVEHNENFHDTVIAAAGNPRLAETVRRTREYHFNYRIALVYTPDEVLNALRGHRDIALALQRRQAAHAEELTRQHVFEALELAVEKLP